MQKIIPQSLLAFPKELGREVEMAGELEIVRLRNDFYRDGFYKVLFALAMILVAVFLLVAVSIYLHLSKPKPISFSVDNEWRVLQPVPLDQAYLNTPDLLQWVSVTLPAVFSYDFVHYADQIKQAQQYFTNNGWAKFQALVKVYAGYNDVQNAKLFVNGSAGGAPIITNQGLLDGRYAWWVQMPLNVNYINVSGQSTQVLTVQALVVRISTLDNLYGVSIENIMISKGGGSPAQANA